MKPAPAMDASDRELQTLESLISIDNQLNGGPFKRVPLHEKGTGLEFEDITYTVVKKQKKEGKWVTKQVDLLQHITGYVPRGHVTAVMGPSGAGKSTFLDALAGRIPSAQGFVTLEGRRVSPSLIKRVSSYVMQDDQLFPMLTVWETLRFAGDMRLPSHMTRAEKDERVEKLIAQLGLSSARNTFIGDEGHRGISGGERRRVSIGVDIVHGPSVLFLDEPTSGLDSTSAYSVIEKVHDIAKAGSNVVLTIHQPSQRIQSLFNHLILLARGKLIYQGTPQGISGHISGLGRQLPKGEDPIEFLLDIIKEFDQATTGVDPLVEYNLTGIRPDVLDSGLTPKIHCIREGGMTPMSMSKGFWKPITSPFHGAMSTCSTPAINDLENMTTPAHMEEDDDDFDHSLVKQSFTSTVAASPWITVGTAASFYKGMIEAAFTPRHNGVKTPMRQRQGAWRTQMQPSFEAARTPQAAPNYMARNNYPGHGNNNYQTNQAGNNNYQTNQAGNNNYQQAGNTNYQAGNSNYPGKTGTKPPSARISTATSEFYTEDDYIPPPNDDTSLENLGPKFANSWFSELVFLMDRNFRLIRRTPELFLSRQMVLTVMGFMMATMFTKPGDSPQGITKIMSFFIFTVCLFFFSSNDAVPTFIQERFIFIRETSHNAYRASSYVIAGVLTYLPFFAIQALTYTVITWWALDLKGGLPGLSYFWLILYSSLIATNSLVVFVSALVPNYILGYSAVIACTALFFLTCGYFVRSDKIPGMWIWLHYISTIKYPYEGLLHNQFEEHACYKSLRTNNVTTCVFDNSQVLDSLSINRPRTKWDCLVILLLWAVFYRILFYLVLRFASKNHRK